MLLHVSLLPVCIGVICSIAAFSFLIRARGYYLKPQGLSFLHRGLARCSSVNYSPEGVVLIRQARLSLLLLAYALFGCLMIYWIYFNTRR
jgi:hypothetical protein